MFKFIIGILCIIYVINREKGEIKRASKNIDKSLYIRKDETIKEHIERTSRDDLSL